MEITDLERRPTTEQDKAIANAYALFEKLIHELRKKELPANIVNTINRSIEQINIFTGSNSDLVKLIEKEQSQLLELVEREVKLVPKNRYLSMGPLLGMGLTAGLSGPVFGINWEIGIPMGMLIGLTIGILLDRRAKEGGKQIDLEL